MTQPAILVENLSKQYQIGSREKGHKTFREALTDLAVAPVRRFRRLSGRSREEEKFWALKDVSFEVQPGEVVGIIGRNGAGKSTLLKILTQITEPTTGRATIRGRVASLLEVGTGFHHELTGRENIFLNGSILGMTRVEIKRKFDQIVDFSGVEKFLDTPVKRYSSGMKVRLAFAVAAHLDPEILLVDEVLAVGDAEFQKKCLGKMSEVAKQGRTVLFVSHSMAAVRHLCQFAILLTQGRVSSRGDASGVITEYLAHLRSTTVEGGTHIAHNDEHKITLKSIELLGGDGQVVTPMQTGADAQFRYIIECGTSFKDVTATIGVNTLIDNVRVCVFYSSLTGDQLVITPPRTELVCTIPRLPLPPGRYRITIKITSSGKVLFFLPGIVEVDVIDGDFYDTGKLPDASWGGVCLVDHSWRAMPGHAGSIQSR